MGAGEAEQRTEVWSLFVDETGPLWKHDQPASLVGLLIEGDGPGLRSELQAAVDAAYADVAYPPHATELRRASGWLRGLLRAKDASPLVEEARAALPSACLDALTTASGRTVQGALQDAGLELAAHPGLAAKLKLGLRRGYDRFRAEIAALDRPDRRAFWVAAFASPSLSAEATLARRYDDALGALFERVLLQLRRPQGRPGARVHVHAAQLYREDRLPAGARRPLMASDLGRVAQAAMRLPEHAETSDPLRQRVRLIFALPRPYDRFVHPGVVVADFLANQTGALLMTDRNLDGLKRAARARVGLPMERVPDGFARALLLPWPTSAEAVSPAAWPTRAWDAEQAELWATVRAEGIGEAVR